MYGFQAIQAALSTLAARNGWPLEPVIYDGEKTTYIVYNEADNVPVEFGDDRPKNRKVDLQVHFFTPLYKSGTRKKLNYMTSLEAIRMALFDYGFTYPDVTIRQEVENDPQASVWHIIFEFEFIETIS